jgi:hypothetical protein
LIPQEDRDLPPECADCDAGLGTELTAVNVDYRSASIEVGFDLGPLSSDGDTSSPPLGASGFRQ